MELEWSQQQVKGLQIGFQKGYKNKGNHLSTTNKLNHDPADPQASRIQSSHHNSQGED